MMNVLPAVALQETQAEEKHVLENKNEVILRTVEKQKKGMRMRNEKGRKGKN